MSREVMAQVASVWQGGTPAGSLPAFDVDPKTKARHHQHVAVEGSYPTGKVCDDRPFRLMDLPLELREDIWELALPEPRVFHLAQICFDHGEGRPNNGPKYGQLRFYINHPPPVVSQVCTESRKAVWRAGCFLFQQPGNKPGVWFNSKRDIIYLDRNQRNALVAYEGKALITVPGMDRVENVGLEWRWFLKDGVRRLEDYSSEEMRPQWTRRMDVLYAYMPSLETIHYVLPMIRHQGGYPWGREPGLFKRLPIELTPLPPETVIPIESGHRSWEQVQEELEKTLSADQVCRGMKNSGSENMCPPKIVGRRLLRVGAQLVLDLSGAASTVRVFDF